MLVMIDWARLSGGSGGSAHHSGQVCRFPAHWVLILDLTGDGWEDYPHLLTASEHHTATAPDPLLKSGGCRPPSHWYEEERNYNEVFLSIISD